MGAAAANGVAAAPAPPTPPTPPLQLSPACGLYCVLLLAFWLHRLAVVPAATAAEQQRTEPKQRYTLSVLTTTRNIQ